MVWGLMSYTLGTDLVPMIKNESEGVVLSDNDAQITPLQLGTGVAQKLARGFWCSNRNRSIGG